MNGLYKQAGRVRPLYLLDRGIRSLGRLFGGGSVHREHLGKTRRLLDRAAAKIKRYDKAAGLDLSDTGASHQFIKDSSSLANLTAYASDLRRAARASERAFGVGAVGATSAGSLWALDTYNKRMTENEEEGRLAHAIELGNLEKAKHKAQQHERAAYVDEQRKLRSSENKAYDKVWSDLAIVLGSTGAAGALGAYIDRRDRLRGFLVGSLLGGAISAGGLALYDRYADS